MAFYVTIIGHWNVSYILALISVLYEYDKWISKSQSLSRAHQHWPKSVIRAIPQQYTSGYLQGRPDVWNRLAETPSLPGLP